MPAIAILLHHKNETFYHLSFDIWRWCLDQKLIKNGLCIVYSYKIFYFNVSAFSYLDLSHLSATVDYLNVLQLHSTATEAVNETQGVITDSMNVD